jgi:hypothetical protein
VKPVVVEALRGQRRGCSILTQNVWQWQATRMNDDTSRAPADPAAYTVRFGANGTISVKADCNAALGTYRVDGNGIEIVVGPMTLAECPPGSLSGSWLRRAKAPLGINFTIWLTNVPSGYCHPEHIRIAQCKLREGSRSQILRFAQNDTCVKVIL